MGLEIPLLGQSFVLVLPVEPWRPDIVIFPVENWGPDKSGFNYNTIFRDSVYSKVAASSLHFNRGHFYAYRYAQLLYCAISAFR